MKKLSSSSEDLWRMIVGVRVRVRVKGIKNISGRNKVVDAKAGDVEHDIVNAPNLFHAGPAKLG